MSAPSSQLERMLAAQETFIASLSELSIEEGRALSAVLRGRLAAELERREPDDRSG